MNKQSWLDFAEILDAYRVFPRLFMVAYIILAFYTGFWAIGLETVGTIDVALVSAVLGVGAAWFGLYVKTGRVWKK